MDIYTYDGKALQYDGKCISPKAAGETWVLNEEVNCSTGYDFTISFVFTYGETPRDGILIEIHPSKGGLVFYYASDVAGEVLAYGGGWTNQAYRTITFLETPTGDLLTWLQANGTKQ